MTDPDFIVAELVAVAPDGSQFDVVVRVGKPFLDNGMHVCALRMGGVDDDKPRRSYGADPMQALHLGLDFVKDELSFLEECGNRLYMRGEDPTGEPFDWRRFWYGNGDPTP